MKIIAVAAVVFMLHPHAEAVGQTIPGRWSEGKITYWYQRYTWIVGCNYIPSTAVNQLEMWQGETFDPETIERELRWASGLGFNTIRVYLHDLAWVADPDGFRTRINKFLDIAQGQKLQTIFVLLDDCWNPNPIQGPQPAPVAGVHNSGWLQSPGAKIVNDSDLWPRVERYVKDVVRAFAADRRVLLWDLYNEPGNSGQGKKSLPLLEKMFAWVRDVQPSQPLSVAVFEGMDEDIESYVLENSDLVTFHNYDDADQLQSQIKTLKKYGRPMICTEWLARTRNSKIETNMPVFKREKVGCLNWGLVAGKTQTIFPWGSKPGSPEPELWFHDLLHSDGKPYSQAEMDSIRSLVGKAVEAK